MAVTYVLRGNSYNGTVGKGKKQFVTGSTDNAIIKAGGSQVIFGGGISKSTTVSSGGVQVLQSANTAQKNNIIVKFLSDYDYAGKVSGGAVVWKETSGLSKETGYAKLKGNSLYYSGNFSDNLYGAPLSATAIYSGGKFSVTGKIAGNVDGMNINISIKNRSLSGKASGYIDGNYYQGTITTSGNYLIVKASTTTGGSSTKITSSIYFPDYNYIYNTYSSVAKKLDKDLIALTSKGSALSTNILAGGKQHVYNGGRSVKTTVSKGGIAYVYSGGIANTLKLNTGGKVQLNGGSLTGTTTLNGGTMTVAARGIKVATIAAKTAAVVKYNVSKLKAGGTTAMLVESSKQALNTGFSIVTAKAQQIGTYRLSSNLTVAKGKAFTIYQGTTKLGTAKLSTTAKLNGVNYTVSQAKNVVSLKLSIARGKIFKGNAKANNQNGTVQSDIFYGGKGNDTINGINGRDVAVYDAKSWGKDTIAKTKGTMTLVLAGLKKTDVSLKKSGSTMTITNEVDKASSITIKGWNAATHNILYNVAASKLKAFNTYLNAASPTEAQKKAAQNSVFKAAKLA